MERLAGKHVLVTGGAGFIGGHLVELLLRKKCIITVCDIQNPGKTYFFLRHLNKKVTYCHIDITKKEQVKKMFASADFSYVIHLAAFPIVTQAYDKPYETFETNIMGTVHMLEECRKRKGIQGIIVASSDKAYGKTRKAYSERSPLKGDHPYDVSKSCTDLIAQTYAKTYGLPIIITRFGNVFGEGDIHVDRIVPGICVALSTNTPLIVRSNGMYVRDYIYVKDVAQAYVFLLKRVSSLSGEAFNVASGVSYSVVDLIKKAQKILNRHISYTIANTAVNEIPYQHLDDGKIRALGWKNAYSFRQALKSTYRWYKSFYA